MENSTKTEQTQEISKKDIMRLLLDIMPDDEAEALLRVFKYGEIYQLFTDEETRESVMNHINDAIISYKLLFNALKRTPSILENKDKILYDYAVSHYNDLSRESKREFCIDMVNQYDFQQDLCETVFDEMIKQIPSIEPLLDTLGVKKNFLSLYNNGGYHKYSNQ